MTAFPIFFAVIENDPRRVLAYSLNNQLGFMVVGIGIGTELALNGAVAHAFADILFKGLLFMSMGAVLFRVGTAKGSELGGLYKSMPWTAGFCLVGAASISAFPLFSGFVTKSMVEMPFFGGFRFEREIVGAVRKILTPGAIPIFDCCQRRSVPRRTLVLTFIVDPGRRRRSTIA